MRLTKDSFHIMSTISNTVQVQMDTYLKDGTPFPKGWGTRSYPFYKDDDFADTFIHMIQWVNESLVDRKVPFHINIPVPLTLDSDLHPIKHAVMILKGMNGYWIEERIPAEFIAIEEVIYGNDYGNEVSFSFRWEDKEY